MRDVKKRMLIVMPVLLLLGLLGSVCVSALNAHSLEATDPSLLPRYADFLLEDFENTGSLTTSSNVVSLSAVSQTDFPPYLPVSGRGMAMGVVPFLQSGEWCFVEKELDIHADLSEFDSLFCYASCQSAGNTLIPVRMTLLTDGGEWEYNTFLTPGVGNTLIADLSELTGDTAIRGVRILFQNGGEQPLVNFIFSLDSLALSYSEDLLSSLNFLADSFSVSAGGEAVKGDDGYTFTLDGSDPYVQTVGFLSSSRKNRLSFSTDLEPESIEVYYSTTASPVFSRDRRVDCTLYGDTIRSAVFELPNETVDEIRVVFHGENLKGQVTLYSFAPLSVFTPIVSEAGQVSSCLISTSKEDVVLSGRLDLTAFEGGSLMLYELAAYEDESTSPLLTYVPLAVSELSEEFTFRFPLYDASGRSRLFSKFLVAYSDGRRLTLIDNAKYISNPSVLAESTVVRPDTTPKGFSSRTRSELIAFGASAVSFAVECEKLITLGASRYSVSVDGENVYFSEAYVEELDRLVKSYDGIGCEAVARLTVKSAGDERIDRLLLHPSSVSGAYGAFNTADENGLVYFRAICDFLLTRYNGSGQGLIGRYVLGDCVNDWGSRYSVGRSGIDVFASAYASALRLLWISCESRGLSEAVFASVSGDVFSFSPAGTLMYADSLTLLSYLEGLTNASTPFAWGICSDPFAIRDNEGYEAFRDALLPFERTLIVDEHTVNTAPFPEEESTKRYIESYGVFASADALLYFITDSRSLNASAALYLDTLKASEVLTPYLGKEAAEAFPLLRSRLFTEQSALSYPAFDVTGRFRLFDFAADTDGFAAGESILSIEGGQDLLGKEELLIFTPSGPGSIQVLLSSPLDLSSAPAVSFEASVASLPEKTDRAILRVSFHAGKDIAAYEGGVSVGDWSDFVCDLSGFERASAIDRITVELRAADGAPLGEPLAVLSSFDLLSPTLTDEELTAFFTPAAGEGEYAFLSPDNKLLVWSLIVVIVLTFSLLMLRSGTWRREE